MSGFPQSVGSSSSSVDRFLRRTGALGETYPRKLSEQTANIAALVSGQVLMQGIGLQGNVALNHVTFKAGSTGATAPTHQFVFITDPTFNVLALGVDLTNTAWLAQTEQQFALAAPFAPAADGLFYVGLVIAATGVPTLDGLVAAQSIGNNETDLAPVLALLGDGGQTTPALLPAKITQSSFSRAMPYAWVS